jgi:hypothetical protein
VRWRSRAPRARALGLELADALLHLGLDVDDRGAELVVRGHVVGRRVDVDVLALGEELAGERVDLGDALDLVAEELDADDPLLARRPELEGVAATRNRARARSASLRWYWRSTRWRSTPSRRYEPPVRSLSTVAP